MTMNDRAPVRNATRPVELAQAELCQAELDRAQGGIIAILIGAVAPTPARPGSAGFAPLKPAEL